MVLVRFDVGRHHREKRVGDDDVHVLVVAEQGRRRQVVEFGQVRAAIPVNGQLGQLLQRPVVSRIRFPELLNIKISFQGVGVDIEALCKKLLSLLGVILGLQGVVHYFLRPDAHPVGGVCHLVDPRVCKIHAAVLHPLRGAGHKNKILFILHRPIQDLAAVFQPLPQEALLIVSSRGNADYQFIGVGLHGLLDDVVLFRGLVGVDLVRNGNVAVE